MAAFSERVLTRSGLLLLVAGIAVLVASGGSRLKFLADDPVTIEPTPLSVASPRERSVDAIYDFAFHTFTAPSAATAESAQGSRTPAQDINTLGEVPDGAWYTNRHWFRRMSAAELARGPGNENSPVPGKWRVISAKSDGVTPGFTIQDSAGRTYLLKLDPVDEPELASGADMIGSRIFYALGYQTPENYIVRFREDLLEIDGTARFRDAAGKAKVLTRSRIHRMLLGQPRDREGYVRALASRFVDGKPIGPFKYSGVRTDDPNDVIRHENRRVLRGLAVFCAWTNHTDSRSQNTLDTVVEKGSLRYIQHYLIDFGSTLGSDSVFRKEPSRGNEYDIDLKRIRRQIFTFGLDTPRWARVDVPRLRGVGHFESGSFHARSWKPAYPNPAFLRMDEADAFWAAKQVARFSDNDIRAMVETAAYTDPRSTEYVAKILRERRDAIVRGWLDGALALDRFEVRDGSLHYAAVTDASNSGPIDISWSVFDNGNGAHTPLQNRGARIPSVQAQYLVARLTRTETHPWVDVYLRGPSSAGSEWKVVGVERSRSQADR